MASTEHPTAIPVEGVYLNDAVEELLLARERLPKRHGPEFRALERAIEEVIDNPGGCIETHWIGGSLMAIAAGRLTEALREARRLGVLRC